MRIPVTTVAVAGNTVVGQKTQDKNGYSALQLGIGTKKRPNKALQGIMKGASLTTAPYFLKEARADDGEVSSLALGTVLKATEVFKPGDVVKVTGVSKGKGFAGGVKRYHFKGGPRTHGQSDRERAPGSIGQTTTPGRVYKGKRMAGRMGHNTKTVSNLQIVSVTDENLMIKGLVPGAINSYVKIEKTTEAKKFVPLFEDKKEEQAAVEEPKEENVQTEQVQEVAAEASEKVEAVSEEKPEGKESADAKAMADKEEDAGK